MTLSRLAPNTIFASDFRVVEPLAEGGMGSVYVVEQVSTMRRRALKVMLPQLVSDPKSRERFTREATVASQVESDHIVEVLAAGVDDATRMPYLVMELLSGRTLAERVEQDGALSLEEVIVIVTQMGHALAAAHHAGIVHRDLKPENVFLTKTRRSDSSFMVKLLDFGIAKLTNAAKHATGTQAIGSPLWMASEQVNLDQPITIRSDVWPLGLLVFWMLTAATYWRSPRAPEGTLTHLLTEVVVGPIDAPSRRAAEIGLAHRIPGWFDAWFARAVNRDASQRYADGGEAVKAFLSAAASAAPIRPPEPPLSAQIPATKPMTPPLEQRAVPIARTSALSPVPDTRTPQPPPEPRTPAPPVAGDPPYESFDPSPVPRAVPIAPTTPLTPPQLRAAHDATPTPTPYPSDVLDSSARRAFPSFTPKPPRAKQAWAKPLMIAAGVVAAFFALGVVVVIAIVIATGGSGDEIVAFPQRSLAMGERGLVCVAGEAPACSQLSALSDTSLASVRVPIFDEPASAVAFADHGRFVCAIENDGNVRCVRAPDDFVAYRANRYGIEGREPPPAPSPWRGGEVILLPEAARDVTCEPDECFAILADGTMHRWGLNERARPVPVPSPVRRFVRTHVSENERMMGSAQCAITAEGTIVCLGDASPSDATELRGFSEVVDAAQAGSWICAVTLDGAMRCTERETLFGRAAPPPRVYARDAKAIVGNATGFCVQGQDDHVRCVASRRLDLGGAPDDLLEPVDAGIVQELAAAGEITCALAPNGTTRCWGEFEPNFWNAERYSAVAIATPVAPTELEDGRVPQVLDGATLRAVRCTFSPDDAELHGRRTFIERDGYYYADVVRRSTGGRLPDRRTALARYVPAAGSACVLRRDTSFGEGGFLDFTTEVLSVATTDDALYVWTTGQKHRVTSDGVARWNCPTYRVQTTAEGWGIGPAPFDVGERIYRLNADRCEEVDSIGPSGRGSYGDTYDAIDDAAIFARSSSRGTVVSAYGADRRERFRLATPESVEALSQVTTIGDCFDDRVCVIDRSGARLSVWSTSGSSASWVGEINLAALLGERVEPAAIGMLDDAARTSATTFLVAGEERRVFRIDGIAPRRVSRPGLAAAPARAADERDDRPAERRVEERPASMEDIDVLLRRALREDESSAMSPMQSGSVPPPNPFGP